MVAAAVAGWGCPRCGTRPSVAGPVRAGQHGYLIFEAPGEPANSSSPTGPPSASCSSPPACPCWCSTPAGPPTPKHPARPASPAAARMRPGSQPEIRGAEAAGWRKCTGGSARRVAGRRGSRRRGAGVGRCRSTSTSSPPPSTPRTCTPTCWPGRPLGQAATAARRALAADPARQITTTPVDLQDWAVPVIYEAAPLALLDPEATRLRR